MKRELRDFGAHTHISYATQHIEKEKIAIQKQTAFGFSDKRIVIFEVTLTKKRHAKGFLDNLLPKISGTDKQMLQRQLDSRVDDDANFFLRFEKTSLAERQGLLLTDGGNCYHIKIKIASFPSTKENAIKIVKRMLANSQIFSSSESSEE